MMQFTPRSGNEEAQALGQGLGDSPEQQVHDGHKPGGITTNVAGDTHPFAGMILRSREITHICAGQDDQHRDTHADAVLKSVVVIIHGGAHAQELNGDGILTIVPSRNCCFSHLFVPQYPP